VATEVYHAKRSIVIRGERARLAAANGLELVYPFYDCDVVRFSAAAPPGILSHRGVHRALLRRAMRGCIPDGVAERRWKADFTKDHRAAVEADAARFWSAIRARGGIVGRDYVIDPKVADACRDGRTAARSGVEHVFSLDAWFRAFFPAEQAFDA
jgi:hypothetical protein